MRDLRRRLLLLTALLIALATPAPAHAVTEVGYSALLAQIKSGPLLRAVINRRAGDIEIKFKNNAEWKAFYPAGAQPMLQRLLHQRHIRVIFATVRPHHAKPRSVHHHLRYIAAGILGALALAGAAWALIRRR